MRATTIISAKHRSGSQSKPKLTISNEGYRHVPAVVTLESPPTVCTTQPMGSHRTRGSRAEMGRPTTSHGRGRCRGGRR